MAASTNLRKREIEAVEAGLSYNRAAIRFENCKLQTAYSTAQQTVDKRLSAKE